MDYSRVYREFIADRKGKPRPDGYTERHHIMPKSLGGVDEAKNLIRLTARDHYFAHCCLAKIYGGKMWSALFAIAAMAKRDENWQYFCKRRMVDAARTAAAGQRSKNMKELWATGQFTRNRIYKPWTETQRAAHSANQMGRKPSPESVSKTRNTKLSRSPVYQFIHLDGRTMQVNVSQFITKTGLSQPLVSCLTRGKIKAAKGWALVGTDLKSIKGRDATIRHWIHVKGQVFTGTVYDFRMANPAIDGGSVSKQVNGKLGVVGGWKLTQKSAQNG